MCLLKFAAVFSALPQISHGKVSGTSEVRGSSGSASTVGGGWTTLELLEVDAEAVSLGVTIEVDFDVS